MNKKMKDKELRDILHAYRPEIDDNDAFMDKLSAQMDAVDAQQQRPRVQPLYRRVLPWVAGIAAVVAIAVLFDKGQQQPATEANIQTQLPEYYYNRYPASSDSYEEIVNENVEDTETVADETTEKESPEDAPEAKKELTPEEKIAELESGLDDRVIEFMKLILTGKKRPESVPEGAVLRFGAVVPDNDGNPKTLLFHCITKERVAPGKEKVMMIPYDVYEDMAKDDIAPRIFEQEAEFPEVSQAFLKQFLGDQ